MGIASWIAKKLLSSDPETKQEAVRAAKELLASETGRGLAKEAALGAVKQVDGAVNKKVREALSPITDRVEAYRAEQAEKRARADEERVRAHASEQKKRDEQAIEDALSALKAKVGKK